MTAEAGGGGRAREGGSRASQPVWIAGNWKMHHGPSATRDFLDELRDCVPIPGRSLVLFPPAVSIAEARRAAPAGVRIGVQNVHWEAAGAFTGETSVPMARDAGAELALIGHSERRHVFGESNDDTGRKIRAVLDGGLTPVLCVGETLAQRRAGRVDEVILEQLDVCLPDLERRPDAGFAIAYEPVWAIGTGETATPDDAAAAHAALRSRLEEALGERGRRAPILYGGSVKPDNAAQLLAAPEVGGVLVGGASLDPGAFVAIARAGL